MTSTPDGRDDRWSHADDLRGYGDANTGTPNDVSRAWARLSRRIGNPGRPVAEFRLFRLGAVAAIVAIVAGLFLLNRPDRHPVAAPQATLASPVIVAVSSWAIAGRGAHLAPHAVVKADEGREVALVFGTRARVTVRSGAAIAIPERTEPIRVADGIVDFQVTPDPAAPSLAEIAVGAPVGIKGVIETDGSLTATSVETELPKLDGLIESVSGTALPLTVKLVGKDVLVDQATIVKFKSHDKKGKGKHKGHGKGERGEKDDDDANEQENEQD